MSTLSPSRRTFLRHTASVGAFTLAASIPLGTARAQTSKPIRWLPLYDPNVFLQIRSDNTVTLISKHSELGQGITTGLATLVAEELDADWRQMRFDFAPANALRYKNLEYVILGIIPLQVTGGSTSTSEAWKQMRRMGAAARAMFVTAAARNWKVSESTIKIENGVIRSGTNKATLGDLAVAAMAVRPPWSVKLKARTDWRLIGANTPLPRLDSVMKTRRGQVRARRSPSGHAHGRGAPSRCIRCQDRFRRRQRDEENPGSMRRTEAAERRRCRLCDEYLGGDAGPQCAEGHLRP
jgi:isoquinoline 1-oxidoreductase beta subunit